MKSRRKMREKFFRWLRGLGIIVPLASPGCGANGNGNGAGEVNAPTGLEDQSLILVWRSDASAPDRGHISGTLANGRHYSGDYIEVIDSADEALYAPSWEGWQPYWSEWIWDGEVEVMDWPLFIEIFKGTVIANLSSDDGQSRLRCRFIIDTPATGLAGGSDGLCQLSDGEIIDDVVLEPG